MSKIENPSMRKNIVDIIEKTLESLRSQSKKKDIYNDLSNSLYNAVFYFTYARLDMEVSKKRNHLLKSPFCVHPKTGKICVPIKPEEFEFFDPNKVRFLFYKGPNNI